MVYSERRWLFSIILSFMLAVTMLWNPAIVMAAETEEDDNTDQQITFINSDGEEETALVTEDGFIYQEINSDGEDMAKIIGYTGSKRTLNVPNEINGRFVMAFSINPHRSLVNGEADYSKIQKISLPKHMTYIKSSNLKKFENLEAISVADGNKTFKSVDGVLLRAFDEGTYRISVYPVGKDDTEWTMPEDVALPYTFYYGCPLEKLTVSSRITDLSRYDFRKLEELKEINVPSSSEYYSSVDGVLYNKDKTELIYYPQGRTAGEFAVPDGVETVEDQGFAMAKIKSVTLPDSIVGIEGNAFWGAEIEKVIFTDKHAPDDKYFQGLKDVFVERYDREDAPQLIIEYPKDGDAEGYEAFIKALQYSGYEPIPDDPEPILLDEDKTVVIEESGQVETFAFVPKEDGDYYFESEGDVDTVGYVIAGDKLVEWNDDYFGTDLETGEDINLGNNFRIYFRGEAGKTYYLQAKVYSSDSDVSFVVHTKEGVNPNPTETPEKYGFEDVPDNLTPIKVGTEETVHIAEPGQVVTFEFTPDEKYWYRFASANYDEEKDYDESRRDIEACIFTSEYEESQISGYDQDFAREFLGEKDRTYYIQIRYASGDVSGDFKVSVTKVEQYSFADVPDNPETIDVGEEKTASVAQDPDVATFAFTPEEDGRFSFEADGTDLGVDLDICVFTPGKYVEYYTEETNTNVRRVYFDGTKGVTYYLQSRTWDYNESEVTFAVRMIGICQHKMEKVKAVKATCTEDGNIEYWKCTICGRLYEDEYVDEDSTELQPSEVVVKALGHDWDKGVVTAGTCEEGATITKTCDRCGETMTEEKEAAGHTLKKVKGIAATCTNEGHEAYWKCTVCDKIFSDKDGKNELNEVVTTPATGHTLVFVERKEPVSYDEPGNIEYWECETCGKLFGDEEGIVRMEEDEVIIEMTDLEIEYTDELTYTGDNQYPEIKILYRGVELIEGTDYDLILPEDSTVEGTYSIQISYYGEYEDLGLEEEIYYEILPAEECLHENRTKVEGVEATCESEGHIEYWICDACGKYFEGETSTYVLDEEDLIIDKLAHNLTVTTAKDATCKEEGNIKYYTCSMCNKIFKDSKATKEISKKDTIVQKIEHTPQAVAAVEATCTEPGLTEGSVCAVCGETLKAQEEIPATGHEFGAWVTIKSPTCEDKGSESRTCLVCGQTETRDLDANGHSWEADYTIDKEATCEGDGSKSIHCAECDAIKDSKSIPATGHTPITIEGKAATCTETGLSEGSKCSVCDKTLVEQEEIPALGHDWDEGVVVKEATCDAAGEIKFTCKHDGTHIKTEEIPATGHAFGGWKVETVAKCEAAGKETRVCANNPSHVETREIPATGHVLKAEAAKAATYDNAGNTAYYICETCGKYFSDATGKTEIKKDSWIIPKLTVKKNATVAVGGDTVKVADVSKKTVTYAKAPKSKASVTVPNTVKIGDATYKVTQVEANAFKGTKATSVTIGANIKTVKANAFKGSKVKTITVKTKALKKSTVKNSLKGSKVKTVKVKVGTKKVNKQYVKKYKKIFTKKIVGTKVTVK